MLTSLGRKPATLEQVRGYVGQGARRLVERAMPNAAAEEIEIGISVFLAYNEEHIVDKTRLYPGVVETLSALRRAGKTLAVVSNKNVSLCSKVLTTLEADRYCRPENLHPSPFSRCCAIWVFPLKMPPSSVTASTTLPQEKGRVS
jgi:phosphoglycolate phosphatase